MVQQKLKDDCRIHSIKHALILLVIMISKFPLLSHAIVIQVPADYSTIQGAINAAANGDTIIVAAGNYPEHIKMKNGIILQGTGGGTDTPNDSTDDAIIDGTSSGLCVAFNQITNTTLKGFTIKNGRGQTGCGTNIYCSSSTPIISNNLITNSRASSIAPGYGGGIYLVNSNAYIINNIIRDNEAWGKGAGIYCQSSAPQIMNNIIHNNVSDYGAGIYCDESSPLIKKNIIDNNFADYQDGGGIYCYSSAPTIENNTIVNNRTGQWGNGQGGAIYCASNSAPKILNNIIAFNEADNSTGGIYCEESSVPDVLNYNDVFINSRGDYFGCEPGSESVSLNPEFVDIENRDYHLGEDSPCINAGDPDPEYNDNDGTRNDMGAYGGSISEIDSDRDGLSDLEEGIHSTNPYDPDTDNDNVLDGEEINLYFTEPLMVDSDNDGSTDGIEIELETDPNKNSSKPDLIRAMTFDNLIQLAFELSQSTYIPPQIQDIPALDPPLPGESEGLTYQESLPISCNNLIDQSLTYAYARPRASLDKQRFKIYLDSNNDGNYDLKSYANANPNYSDPIIQPPINTDILPIAGKVLCRFIVGHYQPGDSYPQFFDFNAAGYVRFNGYLPQAVGSSYRVACHNIFDDNEDFPRFRECYFNVANSDSSILMSLIDSEGFTGAIKITLTPGNESHMRVTAKFFPRRDISIVTEPYTGLVGYSSMFWKDEKDTPGNSTDEAHDCDILTVGYDRDKNGIIDIIKEHKIENPDDNVLIDFSDLQAGKQVYIALENRDREAAHYSAYADAHYENRSSYSIDVEESNVSVSLMLHETPTDAEYYDNIVINLAIKENLTKAKTLNDAVTIKYITKAYFPIDTDSDNLTDQIENIIGTNINDPDTDNDGSSDYTELLAGTSPLIPDNAIFTFSAKGWYLISLPVQPFDKSLSTLFPTALAAYDWNGTTYHNASILETEKGYWLAIPSPWSGPIQGTPLKTFAKHYEKGWHMIGSVIDTVEFTNPNDQPDGSVLTPAYRYDTALGQYVPTDTLIPGQGYWIAVTQECDLTIGGPSSSLSKLIAQADREAFYRQFGSQPPPPPAINWQTGAMAKIPDQFALVQNYPNPFNSQTVIDYQLPEAGRVMLQIYNALGQRVRTLVDEEKEAGYYRIIWDGKSDTGVRLSSGVYFYRIQVNNFVKYEKMLLLM